MSLLSILLLVIFVIAALIMMLVILVQDDQGEGIGGIFGGGSTTPFGSRSGNILTRFTAIMAAVFIMGAFSLAWVNRTPESADIVEKARMERLKTAQDKNWWVERIETPAPQAEAAPSPAPSGSQPEAAPSPAPLGSQPEAAPAPASSAPQPAGAPAAQGGSGTPPPVDSGSGGINR
jgi:preprotein translocase subunit SecG